jgi:hypothetical protein
MSQCARRNTVEYRAAYSGKCVWVEQLAREGNLIQARDAFAVLSKEAAIFGQALSDFAAKQPT